MGQWLERFRTVKGKTWLEDPPERKPSSESVPDWETEWQALAKVTSGITHDDPRFMPVLDALEECDRAFEQGDWIQFRQAAETVQQSVQEGHRGRNEQ